MTLSMPRPSQSRERSRGSSTTPILVFVGIVVLSVVFFFALTLPRQFERKRLGAEMARAQAAEEQARVRAQAAEAAAAAEAPEAQPPKEAASPQTAPVAVRFASPRQFMERLRALLAEGNPVAVAELLGSGALTAEKSSFLETVLTAARLRPAAGAAVREVGDVGEFYRWAIRLDDGSGVPDTPTGTDLGSTGEEVPAPQPASVAGEAVELEVDLARDAATGWRAVAVHFPAPLRDVVAARLGADRVPEAVAAAAEETEDPLKIAGHFLRAVLKQDYAVARAVTDTDQVTREKVAGLCILFEEGGYTVARERPLSATAAGPDSAWVIVKVSSRDGQESDFGLELRRLESGSWQVAGVNFSKLLASYAASAGAAEGVAYSPIVKNPAGGESLVVYFDFNEAGLVPRAQRQLEIVANLLRDDPKRKLRLSGHADAIGSDTYNRRLSAARALAVKDALAGLGVAPQQIVTEGLGTLQPLDPNTKPDGSDNPEGRSRNRRTEIYLDF